MYNKLVENFFFYPKHVGILDINESRTVFFSNYKFSKEVLITLYMHCDSQETVDSITFKTNGNPYVIATLECLCRWTLDKELDYCSFKSNELIQLLDVPFNQVPAILQVQDVYKETVILMKLKVKGDS